MAGTESLPKADNPESCNECSLCCKLLQIAPEGPSVAAPQGYEGKGWNTWCPSCKPGALPGGCQRYESRPIACRQFKCVWLASQQFSPPYALEAKLKPNINHVVLVQSQEDENVLFAFVDPAYPTVWGNEPTRSHLIRCSNRGGTVVICVNSDRYIMTRGRPTFKLNEDQVQQLADGKFIKRSGDQLMMADSRAEMNNQKHNSGIQEDFSLLFSPPIDAQIEINKNKMSNILPQPQSKPDPKK